MTKKQSNPRTTQPETIESALRIALSYLSRRPRTIFEMYQYLKKKQVVEDLAEAVIEKLVQASYLDDEAFAGWFIDSRRHQKPKSRFALGYELRRKGVSPDIIEKILAGHDDREMALKALQPRLRSWRSLDHREFKKKVLNFLVYRGFNHEVIQSLMETIGQSE